MKMFPALIVGVLVLISILIQNDIQSGVAVGFALSVYWNLRKDNLE